MALNKENADAVTRKVEGAGLRDLGKLTERNVRLPDRDWQLLKAHFADKGLALAAGIRMALREYMEKEGLR